ncbi:hypothetical protein [Streptomyces alanosinicus]|uniref:Uncharacterized protein n=1 Tax=Streptomyces alanosinicus TaxID=68171 RepID=A0A919D7X8_9ACTN|nr:hypothetical protein [Streptomyces alanosinicus]GHE11916.1 hypothetical protein GCM10010339_73330 [Streptomyces alanosinicus]
MSTIALLVILLLAVVGAMLAAGLAYVVRRDPSWGQPLTVAFGAVVVLATWSE